MPKNIVLLSDGTGNSSAKLLKTNVWRVYESLDLSDPSKQVACYDDGVGTSSFKPLQVLGGALGVGLKRNVLRLYRFLCEHYDPGDRIYVFGFSRGAFTVRVLVGLVCSQGIVKTRPTSPVAGAYPNHDPAAALAAALKASPRSYAQVFGRELARRSKWAYRGYRRAFNQTGILVDIARDVRDLCLRIVQRGPRYKQTDNHPPPPIAFVGVWDTVDAYGLPVDELTDGINKWVWPLSAPDLELHEKVEKACHALAIDDERNTFHPVLWDESTEPVRKRRATHLDQERISQVWFAGMHSNVGGGYADDALSYVSFKWMVDQAAKRQLHLVQAAVDAHLAKADPFGRIYDSRSGLKGYYRYNPRRIEWLTNGQAHEKAFGGWFRTGPKVRIRRPKIHESVFARIAAAPEAYAPIIFPLDYGIVRENGTILDRKGNPYEPDTLRRRRWEAQERAWDLVWWRRVLYFSNVAATLVFVLWPFLPPPPPVATAADVNVISRLLATLNGIIGWVPDRWIAYYSAHPGLFVAVLAIVLGFMGASRRLQSAICSRMRAIWSRVVPPPGEPAVSLPKPGGVVYRLRSNPHYIGAGVVFRNFVLPFIFGISTLALLALIGAAVVNRAVFEAVNGVGGLCAGTASPQLVTSARTATVETSTLCQGTGMALEEGVRYAVSVQIDAVDGDTPDSMHVTHPKGFTAADAPAGFQKGIFTVFAPFRRVLTADWFVPVARVGAGGFEQHVLIKRANEFTARTDGELFLFVNDAIAPVGPGPLDLGWGSYYRNNHGRVSLTVTKAAPRPVED
jgi:hypothetical protein